jgi:oxalate decarboxylase/phosphoglucose isomerase-like protein (cupin superfamily)
MHHHGNSLDAISIVSGRMEHWLLSPEECEEKRILYEGGKSANKYEGESTIYYQGEWVFIDRRYGHQIENSSKEKLVTLHIRFGAPPDDDKWSPNQGQPITISNQTERYQVILQHNKNH